MFRWQTIHERYIQGLAPALAPALAIAAAICGPSVAEDALPEARSIASLDYCADQYVLAIADRRQILALSRDANTVYSFFHQRADGIPRLRGDTEDVLDARPGLLVRQWRGSATTDQLFERAGIHVLTLPYTAHADQAFEQLLRLGKTIDRHEEAQRFVAERRAMQQSLKNAPAVGLRALYVTPSGYTGGYTTNVETIIKAAGLGTMSDDYGIAGWGPLPIETMVHQKPDLIVTSFFDLPDAVSNWSLGSHPRIGALLTDVPVIDLPARYLTCSSLFEVDAAYRIRQEAARLGLTESLQSPS